MNSVERWDYNVIVIAGNLSLEDTPKNEGSVVADVIRGACGVFLSRDTAVWLSKRNVPEITTEDATRMLKGASLYV